ncbi:MAG: hypothetical protein HWN68_07705 [Desulfobacterales bacterium]|nr:hypothetical protein [Desulfobacterales bacterium]
MERNDLYEYIVIFGVYFWMILSGVVFPEQRTLQMASNTVSMIGMFLFLFLKEAYVQVVASKYDYYRCVVRPLNKILHLFAKKGGFNSVASVNNPNFYTTTLPLGVKLKVKPYGEVEKVVLKHEYPFEKRVITAFGKCSYKGNIVDHRGTATLIVYEFPEASSDVDHAEPVPTYYLKDAPGDFMIGPISPSLPAISGNPNANVIIQKLKRRLLVANQALAEKTRQASYWHQFAIQLEGALRHTKEELSGLLRNAPDFKKGVIRYAQSYVTAIDDIRQLAKMGSPWRMLLKPWMGLVVIAALGMIFLSTRPDILQGMGKFINNPSNQIWVLLIAVIMVGGVYYLAKILRRRKS